MTVENPNPVVQYVDANGTLTPDGMVFLVKLIAELNAALARIEVLEGHHP